MDNPDVCLSGKQRGLLLEPGPGVSLLSSPPLGGRGGGTVREEPSQEPMSQEPSGECWEGLRRAESSKASSLSQEPLVSTFYLSFLFFLLLFYLSRQTETNSSPKIRDASSVLRRTRQRVRISQMRALWGLGAFYSWQDTNPHLGIYGEKMHITTCRMNEQMAENILGVLL